MSQRHAIESRLEIKYGKNGNVRPEHANPKVDSVKTLKAIKAGLPYASTSLKLRFAC